MLHTEMYEYISTVYIFGYFSCIEYSFVFPVVWIEIDKNKINHQEFHIENITVMAHFLWVFFHEKL